MNDEKKELSKQQQQQIWQISDTILYAEASAFLHQFMRDKEGQPLPATQMNGLLSYARSSPYPELKTFIEHQRDRTWIHSKLYIKTFYTELERVFMQMRNERIRKEFHLLSPDLTIQEMQQQADMVMAALAYDFIQHLEAENRLLDALNKDQRQQNRPGQYQQNRPTDQRQQIDRSRKGK
jgi:hypothetical protein